MKKGVLIMAYGSPNTVEEVEPYYTDIRRGRKPEAEALEELIERYELIGFPSPLLKLTNAQADALQNKLGNEYIVYVGMRHWEPWIHEAVGSMINDKITDAVALVMAPHYSNMSIAKYIENVENALQQHAGNINFTFVKSYHNHPLYIKALNNKIADAVKNFSDDEKENLHVIFTAHSLPEKILQENDPYQEQLLETSRILADHAKIINWHFAFQSAGKTQDKWLGPDLLEKIEELNMQGVKSILVCSIGFLIDHLEVMFDIDVEAKELAADLDIHLERAASINDDPLFIEVLAQLVKQRL